MVPQTKNCKKNASLIDFHSVWKGVATLLGVEGVEPPKKIEDLKVRDDSVSDIVSQYTQIILDALVVRQVLYKGYLVHFERVRAIAYLNDILPLIDREELPSNLEEAGTFVERFVFAPVKRSLDTGFQSLFSRIATEKSGHLYLPERCEGIEIETVFVLWESYSGGKSPYERSGKLAAKFLEDLEFLKDGDF